MDMMGRVSTLTLVSLILTSCGEEHSSPKNMADLNRDIAGQMLKLEPGKYRVAFRISDFQIPGLALAELTEAREEMENYNKTEYVCLDREDINKISILSLQNNINQNNCIIDDADISNSISLFSMTCIQDGIKLRIYTNANIYKDAMKAKITTNINSSEFPLGSAKMYIDLHVDRQGDCL